jgi:hypothetical protein
VTFDLIKEWEIPAEKVWRIVTDNAKNMTKAFRTDPSESSEYDALFYSISPRQTSAARQPLDPNVEEEDFDDNAGDEYEDDKESYVAIEAAFGKEQHLPCFLHTLVLALKNPIDSDNSEVRETTKDACRLAGHFARSAKATEKLIELSGKKLLLPAKTRWNYHYHVFRRLLDLKEYITGICDDQGINNIQNWRALRQLVQLLEPFAKWIDYLQGLKYPTIAHALPCLSELLEHLADMKDQNVLVSLCEAIETEIKTRFLIFMGPTKDYNATYIVATALHPILALSLNDSQLQSARQEIVILLKKEPVAKASEQSASSTESLAEQSDTETGISGDMFPHLKRKIQEAKQRGVTAVSSVEEEVNLYFKQLAAFSNVKCELEFWVQHQMQFPALAPLAFDVLAIPASSAAIESAFSIAGHATSGRRHNLSSNLETEVMIKVNKRFL